MIESFLNLLGMLVAFVQARLIPASLAELSLLHVAIWSPVVVGLVALSARTLRSMVRRRPAGAAAPAPAARSAKRAPAIAHAQRRRTTQRQRAAEQAALERKQAAEARQLAAHARKEQAEAQRKAHTAEAAQRAAQRAEKAAQVEARKQARAAAAAQRAQLAAERAEGRRQRATLTAARKQAAEERRQLAEAKRAARAAQPPSPRRPAPAPRDPTSRAFGADPNRIYEFRYRVVELDSLITSNTDTGAINPDYDPTLQPRQRDRAASRRQIEQVARALVPESLLWDFHQLDKGAPIVGSDSMVESGNGRALALRRARADFPAQWQNYQAQLRAQLGAVGLAEAELAGLAHPVLVRERLTEVDRAAFAREANAPPVLQMSTLENAIVDSGRITDAMLLRLHVKEDQSIDQALRARSNAGLVRDFMGTLSENEGAILMRKDGTLNQQGIWRIKAAVFVRVFPGEAGRRLADTFLEALDSTTKNYESAISSTLPALARAESLIASGQRAGDLSLVDDFSRSLDVLARLREQDIEPAIYVEQGNMFERELSPLQERMLLHFDAIGRTPKQIRQFFTAYAGLVEQAPDPKQLGMFGPTATDKGALFDQILWRTQLPEQKAKRAA